jgi:hypothetical protein
MVASVIIVGFLGTVKQAERGLVLGRRIAARVKLW